MNSNKNLMIKIMAIILIFNLSNDIFAQDLVQKLKNILKHKPINNNTFPFKSLLFGFQDGLRDDFQKERSSKKQQTPDGGAGQRISELITSLSGPSVLSGLMEKEIVLVESLENIEILLQKISKRIKFDLDTLRELSKVFSDHSSLNYTVTPLLKIIFSSANPGINLIEFYNSELKRLLESEDPNATHLIKFYIDKLGEANGKVDDENLDKIKAIMDQFKQNSSQSPWMENVGGLFVDYYIESTRDKGPCLSALGFDQLISDFIVPNISIADQLQEHRKSAVCHDFGLYQFIQEGLKNEGTTLTDQQLKEKLDKLPTGYQGQIMTFIQKHLEEINNPALAKKGDLALYKDKSDNRLQHTSVVYSNDEKETSGPTLMSKLGTHQPIWVHKPRFITQSYSGTVTKYYRLNTSSECSSFSQLYDIILDKFQAH